MIFSRKLLQLPTKWMIVHEWTKFGQSMQGYSLWLSSFQNDRGWTIRGWVCAYGWASSAKPCRFIWSNYKTINTVTPSRILLLNGSGSLGKVSSGCLGSAKSKLGDLQGSRKRTRVVSTPVQSIFVLSGSSPLVHGSVRTQLYIQYMFDGETLVVSNRMPMATLSTCLIFQYLDKLQWYHEITNHPPVNFSNMWISLDGFVKSFPSPRSPPLSYLGISFEMVSWNHISITLMVLWHRTLSNKRMSPAGIVISHIYHHPLDCSHRMVLKLIRNVQQECVASCGARQAMPRLVLKRAFESSGLSSMLGWLEKGFWTVSGGSGKKIFRGIIKCNQKIIQHHKKKWCALPRKWCAKPRIHAHCRNAIFHRLSNY